MKFEDMINTIQLGDCYELIKQIPDKSIDLVYIDPPYENSGIGAGCFGTSKRDYHTEYTKLSRREHRREGLRIIDNIKKNASNINYISDGFDYSLLEELDRVMKHTHIYIWCNKNQISFLMKHYEDKGCNVDLLVWCKTNPIPTCNNKYLSDLEYCVFARNKNTPLNGFYQTKSKYYISGANVQDKDLFKHPTIKPLELVKNHIINSTKPNDIVLDCFCGSGTTCVACKETGRRYIGMEIDPEYHKIAVNRLNGITADGQLSIFTDISLLGEQNGN